MNDATRPSGVRTGLGRLAGRSALITGGARGIGRAIAEAYLAEGASVGIVDLKQERIDAALAELARIGDRVHGWSGDVGRREVLERACEELLERTGRFDVLVSNAMWARYQPLAELTEANLDTMLAVGFKAVVWGMQISERLMVPRGGGVVINIGSMSALRSHPNSLVYSGIKAGIGGLTRSGGVDLGPKGIRVNAIGPGTTLTDGVVVNVSEEGMRQRISRTPLRRLGAPSDIADAAIFLASDESAWINGTTLYVDGGMSAAHL